MKRRVYKDNQSVVKEKKKESLQLSGQVNCIDIA